jgi:hypothetical protein
MPQSSNEKDGSARMEQARKWVELAIATGHGPLMTNQSGEWGLQLGVPHRSGQPITSNEELPPIPRELWDEIFQVCKELGRVYHVKEANAS